MSQRCWALANAAKQQINDIVEQLNDFLKDRRRGLMRLRRRGKLYQGFKLAANMIGSTRKGQELLGEMGTAFILYLAGFQSGGLKRAHDDWGPDGIVRHSVKPMIWGVFEAKGGSSELGKSTLTRPGRRSVSFRQGINSFRKALSKGGCRRRTQHEILGRPAGFRHLADSRAQRPEVPCRRSRRSRSRRRPTSNHRAGKEVDLAQWVAPAGCDLEMTGCIPYLGDTQHVSSSLCQMHYSIDFYAFDGRAFARLLRESPDNILADVEKLLRHQIPNDEEAWDALRDRAKRFCRNDLPDDCDRDYFYTLSWLANAAGAEPVQICGFDGFRHLGFLGELAIWPELQHHPCPFPLPQCTDDHYCAGYMPVEAIKTFTEETFRQLPPSIDRDVINLRDDFHYTLTTLADDNLDLLAILTDA